MKGSRREAKRNSSPRVEGNVEECGTPPGTYSPLDRCRRGLLFDGEYRSPHEKCFHFPREPLVHTFSSYRHMYGFSSEGCNRCTSNHGFPW